MTIDQAHDAPPSWRLVERRSFPRKRVSATFAGLRGDQKNWRGKPIPESVTIEDLSDNGARLISPLQEGLAVGDTIEIELSGRTGQVVVRYIAEDPLHADQTIYGVEVASMDADLRAAIRERMEEEQTALEWVWEQVARGDRLAERRRRLERAPRVIRPRTVPPRPPT